MTSRAPLITFEIKVRFLRSPRHFYRPFSREFVVDLIQELIKNILGVSVSFFLFFFLYLHLNYKLIAIQYLFLFNFPDRDRDSNFFFLNLFYLKFSRFVVPSGNKTCNHYPSRRGNKNFISIPRDSFSKMDRFSFQETVFERYFSWDELSWKTNKKRFRLDKTMYIYRCTSCNARIIRRSHGLTGDTTSEP